MLKRLIILLILLGTPVGYIAAEKALYVVTTNKLNVRTGPGKEYGAYGTFKRGDTILVKSVNGQWAAVQDDYYTGYVNTRYIRYVRPWQDAKTKASPKPRHRLTVWDKLYEYTKVVLWIWVIIAVIGYFINDSVSGFAIWMLIFCGIGALIGWMFWDNGTAGAVIATGMELALLAFFIYKLTDSVWLQSSSLGALSRGVWALGSFPFFTLNLLQFWLSKPWRPFMKRNVFPESSKPSMRKYLRMFQIPFYIALFPLRLINAVYYNMVIYNLYAWSNYIIEVILPSDTWEGADNAAEWVKYLPQRIGKYLLWHGSLTIVESVAWTVIDTFVPAVTLYHGTAAPFADNMLCDPDRSNPWGRTKGWKTGVWDVGGGNYAGDGIYFGIFRSTLRNYQKGTAIAARVTMGKTIDTVLMPNYVYAAAGKPGAKAVSNWGLNHGYVTGEWWRADGRWWEICLYDRQNRYNESWRIRPIYAIYAGSGIMQRIKGGPAHWLFRQQVIDDMEDTLRRSFR